jgi:serine/threonine protein kinase
VNRPLVRRQRYVRALLAQALQGLNFLHSNNILHQSLGANSVLVSSTSEQDVATLSVRLQVLTHTVSAIRRSTPALVLTFVARGGVVLVCSI